LEEGLFFKSATTSDAEPSDKMYAFFSSEESAPATFEAEESGEQTVETGKTNSRNWIT
jgi:hypothetical protein